MPSFLLSRLFLFAALLAGCAPLSLPPERTTLEVPSPNHDARRPNFIVLHDTSSNTSDHALTTLTDPRREVSAHYLIDRDGTLYRLVNESRRAWHAGVSYWGGLTDLNSASLGIELDNTGDEAYSEAQITRLLGLLGELQSRHRIPPSHVIGHGDIAPTRKVDPSRHFPWQRLAEAGFGRWCHRPDLAETQPLPDPWLALQALGYDPSAPLAALAAFRRHFRGIESDMPANEADQRLLACLLANRFSVGSEIPARMPVVTATTYR